MKPKVYIETTIPSYLTAWPSQDIIRAGHQQITREWWAARDRFDLYTSAVVIRECQAGDADAASDRIEALKGIPLLSLTRESSALAEELIQGVPLPARAETDALHIAIAAVEGMTHLLTWNCTHIANPIFLPKIESVCRGFEYVSPLICTPEQLLGGSQTDDRG